MSEFFFLQTIMYSNIKAEEHLILDNNCEMVEMKIFSVLCSSISKLPLNELQFQDPLLTVEK